jgi:hypothetical protein
MQRDMDLIRAILLKAEATPANQQIDDVEPEGWTEDEIAEHVEMLIDGDLLDGKVVLSGMGDSRIHTYFVKKITWKGREFIDATRNETVWAKTKKLIAEKGGGVPFEITAALAIEAAKRHFLGP